MKYLKQLISSGSIWIAESSVQAGKADPYNVSKVELLNKLGSKQHCKVGQHYKAGPFSTGRGHLKNLLEIKTSPANGQCIPFNIPEIDSALAEHGLVAGSVHEWFSDIYPASIKDSALSQLSISTDSSAVDRNRSSHYREPIAKSLPPFALLSHIATQSLKYIGRERYVLWIGRDCWPSAFLFQLYSDTVSLPLIEQSLFFDTSDKLEKIWAIDLALRSKACAAVICESRGLPFNLSKRFSLAARKGGGVGLLVRSSSEMRNLQLPSSTASTKWLISPVPSNSHPAWKLRLLKKKGVQANLHEWILHSELSSSGKLVLHAVPCAQLDKSLHEERSDFYKPRLLA